jgi:DNA-binding response OmpR family regulator
MGIDNHARVVILSKCPKILGASCGIQEDSASTCLKARGGSSLLSPNFHLHSDMILAMATILWIRRSQNITPTFVPGLREKGYIVETMPTAKAALACAARLEPDLAVVNAPSLRTNGWGICRTLHNSLNGIPVLLIAGEDQRETANPYVSLVLVLPFTLRKLVNRIKALVPESGEKPIRAGEISLYPEARIVQVAGGRPQRLTPRMVMLLKMLMESPGAVLKREHLFQKVWQTDYVEDTRTLDIHISWLRGKIEKDACNPQFIKTLRGVGFRLDI